MVRIISLVSLLAAVPGCSCSEKVVATDAGAATFDTTPDASPPDAGPPDAGADAGGSDGGIDAGATIDAGPPDAGATDAGSTPCTFELAHTYGADMVVCGPGAMKISADQCEAEATFCAPGWTLCTASQFLARGGMTDPAPYAAWIAGCIREGGGAVTTPTDRICACTPGARASLELLGIGCDGTTEYRADGANIGIVASPGCYAAGPSGVGPMARWQPMPTPAAWTGAVCCQ
jgi:hypothetical protein